jgi:3-phenylpropionate/trans-cinnamate dioxygenase ferredoxin subunit
MTEHRACLASEVLPSTPKVVRISGIPVLLCASATGELFAFENKCTHADLPLHKGPWDPVEACLTCPAHQAVFALREGGKPTVGPAVVPLELFPVRRAAGPGGEWIYVDLPEDD